MKAKNFKGALVIFSLVFFLVVSPALFMQACACLKENSVLGDFFLHSVEKVFLAKNSAVLLDIQNPIQMKWY